MYAEIWEPGANGKRIELIKAPERCGDWCDSCGDCLFCSHEGDYCDGRWVLYTDTDAARIAEIRASSVPNAAVALPPNDYRRTGR